MDHTGTVLVFQNTTLFNKYLVATPDFSKVLVWSDFSTTRIYDTATLSELHSEPPGNIPIPGVTQKIAISQDSTLAIIETSSYNPIKVLNLTDYTVAYSVPITGTIFSAHFLDSSNTMIVVFELSSTYIVNLTSGAQYPIPLINATDYTTDMSNSIFTCHNNVIEQLQVTFGSPVSQ